MNNKLSSTTPWVRRHPFLTFFAFLFVVISISSFSSEETTSTNVTSNTEPVVLTLDQKFKNLIAGKKFTYINKEQDEDLVSVTYNIDSFYTKDSLIRQTGEISGSIFQEIFTLDSKINNIFVDYTSTTTDKFGNSENISSLSYVMNRETFNKINWTSFNKQNLCAFAKSENKNSKGETDCLEKVNFK